MAWSVCSEQEVTSPPLYLGYDSLLELNNENDQADWLYIEERLAELVGD